MPADELKAALDLVQAFRAEHSYPLTQVTMGLRHHAKKVAGPDGYDLSQRMKQLATIRDKLVRLPRSNLARMQDLGGCRATFSTQAEVDDLIASIQDRARRKGSAWEIAHLADYVANTRADGYRAKHLIVRKSGVLIEIQVRTIAQHHWAQLVEDLDKALGLGLKRGSADQWAVSCVAAASGDMRKYELGAITRPELIGALNRSLRPILERSKGRIV